MDNNGITIDFVRTEWQLRGGVHLHQFQWHEISRNSNEQQLEVEFIEDGEDEIETDAENEANGIDQVDKFEDRSGHGSEEEEPED